MRYVVAALAGGLMLGGCVSGARTAAQAACTEDPSYLNSWACIRAKVASGGIGSRNDESLHYLAVGDALAERVRSRQISDADAKVALASELRQVNAVSDARQAAASDALIAAGAAISAPPPSPFPPSISCTSRRIGDTIRTDC